MRSHHTAGPPHASACGRRPQQQQAPPNPLWQQPGRLLRAYRHPVSPSSRTLQLQLQQQQQQGAAAAPRGSGSTRPGQHQPQQACGDGKAEQGKADALRYQRAAAFVEGLATVELRAALSCLASKDILPIGADSGTPRFWHLSSTAMGGRSSFLPPALMMTMHDHGRPRSAPRARMQARPSS